MPSKFEIRTSEPMVRNADTDDQYTMKLITLKNEQGDTVANGEVYVDDGYYSVCWISGFLPMMILEKVEACLAEYDKEAMLKNGEVQQQNPTMDVISVNNEAEEPYERPLSWERVEHLAGGGEVEIKHVRVNTPYGDFGIENYPEGRLTTVLSHLKDTQGFVNFFKETSSLEGVDADLVQFWQAVISALGI